MSERGQSSRLLSSQQRFLLQRGFPDLRQHAVLSVEGHHICNQETASRYMVRGQHLQAVSYHATNLTFQYTCWQSVDVDCIFRSIPIVSCLFLQMSGEKESIWRQMLLACKLHSNELLFLHSVLPCSLVRQEYWVFLQHCSQQFKNVSNIWECKDSI